VQCALKWLQIVHYKIAIVAGEESGDLLAANLMRALKEQMDSSLCGNDKGGGQKSEDGCVIELIGVGGSRLIQEGLTPSFPMETLAIGGYGLDVITAIPKILHLRHKLIRQIINFKPDVFIGVDAPDFNLYLEKKLKEAGIKTVHYVSPTIWAWRYKRIFKIKKAVDLVLCIFPFEVALYNKEHIAAKFIGHHLADQIEMDIDIENARNKIIDSSRSLSSAAIEDQNSRQKAEDRGQRAENNIAYNLGLSSRSVASKYSIWNDKKSFLANDRVFTVLVGSRKSEIESLGQVFIATCNIIARQIKDAIFLFPLVNERSKEILLNILNKSQVEFKYQVLVNQTSNAIKSANIVLAKSGTVTLEVALCKKPMVISYKVSKFTAWMIRRKILIKYVGLPNILLNEEVAPELLQENATPDSLAKGIIDLFHDKTRQVYVVNKFYELHNTLRCNASKSAANAILELINHAS